MKEKIGVFIMQIYRQFSQTLPMHKYFVRNYFSSSLMIFNRYIWHHSLQIFPLLKTTFAIHNFQCTINYQFVPSRDRGVPGSLLLPLSRDNRTAGQENKSNNLQYKCWFAELVGRMTHRPSV